MHVLPICGVLRAIIVYMVFGTNLCAKRFFLFFFSIFCGTIYIFQYCFEKVGGQMSNNIISGFRKCGIFPLNPNQVYSRLPPGPSNPTVSSELVDEVFT